MIELKTFTETSTSVFTSLQYIIKNLSSLVEKDSWYWFKVIWRHKQEFLFFIWKKDSSHKAYFVSVKWNDGYIDQGSRFYSNKLDLEKKIKELLHWVGFQSRINEYSWNAGFMFSSYDTFDSKENFN